MKNILGKQQLKICYLMTNLATINITVIILLFPFFLFAQEKSEIHPYRLNIEFGLSYPTNVIPNGFGLGVLAAIEPKYDINKFSLGMRVGVNILRASPDAEFLAENQIDKFDANFLLTGDYHILNGKFKPFIGTGIGLYLLSATSGYDITSEKGEWKSYGAKFGGLIRSGIEISHFRMFLQYNLIGSKSKQSYGNINFDYFSINFSGWFRL